MWSPTQWLWRVQCRLNRRLIAGLDPVAPAEFVARSASTEVLAARDLPGVRPELCVVLTTHDRPSACAAVLEALEASLRDAQRLEQTFVLVFVDRAACDYTPVVELLARSFEHFAVYESTKPIGKRGFWFTYQAAFRAIQRLRPAHSLFLQDDVTFDRSLVREVFERWEAIGDPDKAVMYLCAMEDDESRGRWIEYPRRELKDAGVWLTQWFDLQAFLAHPRFFERLHFDVFPVHARRWRIDPGRSSGVGEQFTLRLYGRANVYQVRETLVYHGALPSLMNPEARRERPLDNRVQIR